MVDFWVAEAFLWPWYKCACASFMGIYSSSFHRRERRSYKQSPVAECGWHQAVQTLDHDMVSQSLEAWALIAFLYQKGMTLSQLDNTWVPRNWLHFPGPNCWTVLLMSNTLPFHFSISILAATCILDGQYTKRTKLSVSSLRVQMVWEPSATAFSM